MSNETTRQPYVPALGLDWLTPFYDPLLRATSLVLRHLTTENKRRTLAKVRALLRPGGELHVADWGRPHNGLMWIASFGIRWLDGARTTADNLDGRLLLLMEEAGFSGAEETHQEMTRFGTLSLFRAVVPCSAG